MAYKRDNEALKEILHGHSVAGYPVEVPIFGAATILRQGGTSPVRTRDIESGAQRIGSPMPFFVVQIDHPMPFRNYAEGAGISAVPLPAREWERLLEEKQTGPIGDSAILRIDAGRDVSPYEATYSAMKDGGQLDSSGNVVMGTFSPQQVQIPDDKLKPNMLVEFSESKESEAGIPGRYWGQIGGATLPERPIKDGFDRPAGNVALLELFSPMPYMEAPDAVASVAIKKDFCSKYTYALGYGLAQAWEMQYGKLPPGEYASGAEFLYMLTDPQPISKVEKLCRELGKKEGWPPQGFDWCVWQAMVMNILPVYMSLGVFRPLPENVISEDMVIEW